MSRRVRTLLLHANGSGPVAAAKDTLLQGLLGLPPDFTLPEPWRRVRVLDRVFTIRDRYAMLSYVADWIEAFRDSPRLEVEACNINNLVDYRRRKDAIASYPLVLVLHSAAGDHLGILSRTAHWYSRRRGALAVFIGNEYNLMPQKIAFIRETGAEYLCSQLPLRAARWLYAECAGTTILAAPHALNPRVYRPISPPARRPIDIGFCGAFYPWFIGDRERTALIEWFRDQGPAAGLRCAISPAKVPRDEWASLLNSCRGIPGAEAGTYRLERTDETIRAVQSFLRKNPAATFGEVRDRFFRDLPPTVSGKAISSRHFEPMGTMTLQILVEGEYNGILAPGEHYIPVSRDLSDIGAAVARFREEAAGGGMAARAHQYAMDAHTYRHRVEKLLDEMGV
jgi:hypothetical protein